MSGDNKVALLQEAAEALEECNQVINAALALVDNPYAGPPNWDRLREAQRSSRKTIVSLRAAQAEGDGE